MEKDGFSLFNINNDISKEIKNNNNDNNIENHNEINNDSLSLYKINLDKNENQDQIDKEIAKEKNNNSINNIKLIDYTLENALEDDDLNDIKNNKDSLNGYINIKKYLIFPFCKIIIEKKIGEGGFGKVFAGVYLTVSLAIKQIEKKIENNNKEIHLLKVLKHCNLPIFYGLIINKSNNNKLGDNKKELINIYSSQHYYSLNSNYSSILIERIRGVNMKEFIDRDDLKNVNDCDLIKLKIVLDFTQVLFYVHSNNIIHRDLSANNIMIDNKLRGKLLDFGISKITENTATTDNPRIGCLLYYTPEHCPGYDNSNTNENSDKVSLSHKSDVWALGLLINQFFSGELPWIGKKQVTNYYVSIINLTTRKPFPISKDIKSKHIKSIIEKCVQYDKNKRYSSGDVYVHSLFSLFKLIKDSKENNEGKDKNNGNDNEKGKNIIYREVLNNKFLSTKQKYFIIKDIENYLIRFKSYLFETIIDSNNNANKVDAVKGKQPYVTKIGNEREKQSDKQSDNNKVNTNTDVSKIKNDRIKNTYNNNNCIDINNIYLSDENNINIKDNNNDNNNNEDDNNERIRNNHIIIKSHSNTNSNKLSSFNSINNSVHSKNSKEEDNSNNNMISNNINNIKENKKKLRVDIQLNYHKTFYKLNFIIENYLIMKNENVHTIFISNKGAIKTVLIEDSSNFNNSNFIDLFSESYEPHNFHYKILDHILGYYLVIPLRSEQIVFFPILECRQDSKVVNLQKTILEDTSRIFGKINSNNNIANNSNNSNNGYIGHCTNDASIQNSNSCNNNNLNYKRNESYTFNIDVDQSYSSYLIVNDFKKVNLKSDVMMINKNNSHMDTNNNNNIFKDSEYDNNSFSLFDNTIPLNKSKSEDINDQFNKTFNCPYNPYHNQYSNSYKNNLQSNIQSNIQKNIQNNDYIDIPLHSKDTKIEIHSLPLYLQYENDAVLVLYQDFKNKIDIIYIITCFDEQILDRFYFDYSANLINSQIIDMDKFKYSNIKLMTFYYDTLLGRIVFIFNKFYNPTQLSFSILENNTINIIKTIELHNSVSLISIEIGLDGYYLFSNVIPNENSNILSLYKLNMLSGDDQKTSLITEIFIEGKLYEFKFISKFQKNDTSLQGVLVVYIHHSLIMYVLSNNILKAKKIISMKRFKDYKFKALNIIRTESIKSNNLNNNSNNRKCSGNNINIKKLSSFSEEPGSYINGKFLKYKKNNEYCDFLISFLLENESGYMIMIYNGKLEYKYSVLNKIKSIIKV